MDMFTVKILSTHFDDAYLIDSSAFFFIAIDCTHTAPMKIARSQALIDPLVRCRYYFASGRSIYFHLLDFIQFSALC